MATPIICDTEKRVLWYQLWDQKTLPMFRLNASVFIRVPWCDWSIQSKSPQGFLISSWYQRTLFSSCQLRSNGPWVYCDTICYASYIWEKGPWHTFWNVHASKMHISVMVWANLSKLLTVYRGEVPTAITPKWCFKTVLSVSYEGIFDFFSFGKMRLYEGFRPWAWVGKVSTNLYCTENHFITTQAVEIW